MSLSLLTSSFSLTILIVLIFKINIKSLTKLYGSGLNLEFDSIITNHKGTKDIIDTWTLISKFTSWYLFHNQKRNFQVSIVIDLNWVETFKPNN